MLALPESGMRRSIQKHNVDLAVLTDWCEGSVLFVEDQISQADVADVLVEMEVYEDQDFASAIAEDAWAQLQLRQRWLGSGAPFRVEQRTLVRASEWDAVPAHSFCLIVALLARSRGWTRKVGDDFPTQGELFERIAAESLEQSGWSVLRTGWSKSQPAKLDDVVAKVAAALGEAIGRLAPWTDKSANEAGLDLVCYLPFADGRGGKPVFLTQCASGADWETKVTTPELTIWTKVIDFSSTPQKAFVLPFALLQDEFPQISNRVDGMLIDRYRLLAPARQNQAWVSGSLKNDLLDWLKPRVDALPTDQD